MTSETDLARVAVVVVNFRTSRLLEANLVRLQAAVPELGIYVVDNYSSEVERATVVKLGARQGWTVIEAEGNRGFGAACNEGARCAMERGASWLLFLNPDAMIDRQALQVLTRRVAEESRVLVSPKIVRPDGSVWSDGNFLDLADGTIRSRRALASAPEDGGSQGELVPWVSGACLMVSADSWNELRGFDEEYFMYWEDVDLGYRAHRAGFRQEVLLDAVCVHDEGQSQTQVETGLSPLYYRMNIRNRLMFAARRLPEDARSRWRRATPRVAMGIARRARGRRQFLRNPALVGQTVGAAVEGLRLSRKPALRDPLKVVLSFPEPKPTSNPYNMLMKTSLDGREGLQVDYFSWRRVLTSPVDVFHVHWPESAMEGRNAAKSAGKHLAFATMLVAFRLRGTAWVRTVHNTELPRGISRATLALLKIADRTTVLRIIINPFTPVPPGDPFVTIPHGRYTEWLAQHPRSEVTEGQVAYVGTIRAYKGVPQLISAFRDLDDPRLSLTVAGRLSHQEYEPELRQLAESDDRVRLNIGFVSDAELVRTVTSSELVVLPYPEMHNSGMVLCVLSLERPVLVPENVVTKALQAEVGPGWIHTFRGDLSAADLRSALAAVRSHSAAPGPDLSSRDWDLSGERHAQAYRRAAALRHGLAGSVIDPS